jgi:GNAT superfamily N-acetyltransferase
MRVTLNRRAEWTDEDFEEFYALDDAVYPTGLNGPPGMERVVWADPEWDVIVRDAAGLLVTHAGVLLRDALLDGRPLRIAGVAEVLTHPDHRRQGYAAAALTRAADFMRAELAAPFALLFCPEAAIPFYASVGWQRFNGVVLTEIDGKTTPFPYGPSLVLPLRDPAPTAGTLDLRGIPW